ncbi:MAG: hypothetical protein H6719_27890 [Sandaracinaceae bacterium]|nr:hypothetical protein [Sandaracinaceae bacterium]
MTIERQIEYLHDQIDVHVRCGYGTEARVLERIREQVSDELRKTDGAEIPGLMERAKAAFGRQRELEATWDAPTMNDRIDHAFDALLHHGVVALQDAGYTMSDGWEDIAEARRDAPNAWGGTFFHRQDVERGVNGGGLMLAFGAFESGPRHEAESLRLGRLICDELRRWGVPTEWDGTLKRRIAIPGFEWRKRRTTHVRITPGEIAGTATAAHTLTLGGRDEPFRGQALEPLLADVAAGELDFLVLANDATGSYVQAAEAYGELIAEWRDVRPDGFTHVKLCLPGRSDARRPPKVPGYEGYLDKEILSVEDVVTIFEAFAERQAPPDFYERIDISASMGG